VFYLADLPQLLNTQAVLVELRNNSFGGIVLWVFTALDSDAGENKFGVSPKVMPESV
jgi:hypothetical protein